MKTTTPIAIISAELDTLSGEVNSIRTLQLQELLSSMGAEVIPATGCYKGSKEQSFVVKLTNGITEDNLVNLGKTFDQDSVFLQDANQNARLVYGSGKVESLPTPRQVTETVALSQDAWTKIGDKYFA